MMLLPPACATCGRRLGYGHRIRCVAGCGAWVCRRSLPPPGKLRPDDPRKCANEHARVCPAYGWPS
jgi:hypothetical protein